MALIVSGVIADSSKPSVSFGEPISEDDIAAWDIDIETESGKGLPPGSGSVAEGKALFTAQCVACHGVDAEGGSQYGSMVGDYIRRAMPMTNPQSLTDDETYALTAYIYALNGLVNEDATLDADSLAAIDMPNKDGFIIDDRPDAAATRCLSDCE